MKIKHPIFGDIFPLSRWKKTLFGAEHVSATVPVEKDVLSVELLDKMHEDAGKHAAHLDYTTYRLAQLTQAYSNELFKGIMTTAIKRGSAEAQSNARKETSGN